MIYLLFITIVLLFIISYLFTKKIFSPSCLMCISYIIAVYFAILNINNWMINLSSKTYEIIIIGIISFIMPSIFMCLIYRNNKKLDKNIELRQNERNKDFKIINVDSKIITFFVFIEIIALILYIIFSMKSMGVGFNIFEFFSKISTYRMKKIDGEDITEIPFYIKQLVKISKAFFFCYTYVVINNLIESNINKRKYKIPFKYIISIILLIIMSIFSASRFDLAIIMIYIGILYYMLTIKKNKMKKVNMRKILKIVAVLMVIIYLFSATKEIFGRTGEYTTLEYISHYFGGSIELLDLYIKNPVAKSSIWGKETFYAVNKTLNSLGIINADYTIHLEWRYSNGISIGNVYTALRMYYSDFGLTGVIFLQILFSIIITLFYIKVLDKNYANIDFKMIVYCYIIFSLVLHSYRDFFYSQILSVNYINIVFYIYLVKIIMEKIKFKGRKGVIYDE